MKKPIKKAGNGKGFDDIDPEIVKKYTPAEEEETDQDIENTVEGRAAEEPEDPDLDELKDIASTKRTRRPGNSGGKVGGSRKQKEEEDADDGEEDEDDPMFDKEDELFRGDFEDVY